MSDLGGISGRLVRAARVIWFAGGEFRRDFCFERAATLSFATIISLIPLVVLLLGIAVQFGVGDSFIQYAKEKAFPSLAPAFQTDLSAWLEKNLSRRAFASGVAGVVGFLALLSLIATAMGGLTAAERIFNRVWKVEGTRTYLQKLVTFWAILTVSPFIMTASLWIEDFLVPHGGVIERLTQSSILLRALYGILVPTVIGFAGFTVLYRYLPAARVRLKSAVLAGLTAAVLWELSKRGFYVYVARSTTVTSLYGPLSIVPLFLVWVYVNWAIILWGCEVAYAHQNLAVLSDLLERSSNVRRLPLPFIGMYLLERIGRAFAAGAKLPDASAVGDDLSVRTSEVEEAGRLLVEAGLLVEDSGRSGLYALGRAPEFIRLSDVATILPHEEVTVAGLRDSSGSNGGGGGGPALEPAPAGSSTMDLFLAARARHLSAFSERTLADLINDSTGGADKAEGRPKVSHGGGGGDGEEAQRE